VDAIQAYLDELYRWNQRINLTAVPREQAEQKHVAESTALLDAVAPADGARLVDVGSGGGVPGIPIAVARPDLRVVLLESDQRKAAFLTHACGLLQLGNVEVVCARAEDEARREGMREAFDVAVSRALASPPSMCELLLPLVRVGGMVATLVGDAALAKRESAHAAELLGGAPPQMAPGGVLLVEKLVPTPDLYPRRAGLPTRRPLR
jgi:16S rRNA (guanine527-N7)-methyltransferase